MEESMFDRVQDLLASLAQKVDDGFTHLISLTSASPQKQLYQEKQMASTIEHDTQHRSLQSPLCLAKITMYTSDPGETPFMEQKEGYIQKQRIENSDDVYIPLAIGTGEAPLGKQTLARVDAADHPPLCTESSAGPPSAGTDAFSTTHAYLLSRCLATKIYLGGYSRRHPLTICFGTNSLSHSCECNKTRRGIG